MTTRTYIKMNETEDTILKLVSWGEYDRVGVIMDGNEFEAVKVTTEYCDQYFEEHPQEYNDLLGVIKKHLDKITPEGAEDFFKCIMKDLARGKSELAKHVSRTHNTIKDRIMDNDVIEENDDNTVSQIAIVSMVTSALGTYFETMNFKNEDVEKVTVTSDNVIGIAADSSKKYRETSAETSNKSNHTLSLKEIAQEVMRIGVLDDFVDSITSATSLAKLTAAEFVVDLLTIMMEDAKLFVTNKGNEAAYHIMQLVTKYCTNYNDAGNLSKLVEKFDTDVMDVSNHDVNDQIKEALDKLHQALAIQYSRSVKKLCDKETTYRRTEDDETPRMIKDVFPAVDKQERTEAEKAQELRDIFMKHTKKREDRKIDPSTCGRHLDKMCYGFN